MYPKNELLRKRFFLLYQFFIFYQVKRIDENVFVALFFAFANPIFLIALSLNEKIIVRLWKFLYSLGPDGGLKAILSYVTGGSDALPDALNALLMLFCDCCAHLLPIIDDGEFYEQQKPFTLEESIKMSAFLNSLVFKMIWTRETDGM